MIMAAVLCRNHKHMINYIVFLRGIGPGNPNMSNDKLRGVCESLGFTHVQSVIASGNIIFQSNQSDIAAIESAIEQAIARQLGFTTTAIVRTQAQLQTLVAANPFKNLEHNRTTYLLVTFLKRPAQLGFTLPYKPPGKAFTVLTAVDTALCSVSDVTVTKTPDLMTWLEKELGKDITSRTWNTVQRIVQKFEQ